jgi:hypothetical protein
VVSQLRAQLFDTHGYIWRDIHVSVKLIRLRGCLIHENKRNTEALPGTS